MTILNSGYCNLRYFCNSSDLIHMTKKKIFSILFHVFARRGFIILPFLFFSLGMSLQTSAQSVNIVKGMVLDMDKQTPLPYSNIIVLHKNRGTISNEKGFFSLDITKLDKNDSLSFQYIGYETKVVIISELDSITTIYLKEAIINLSEAFVFGNPPDPEVIVKSTGVSSAVETGIVDELNVGRSFTF